jgi:hypothetical protein
VNRIFNSRIAAITVVSVSEAAGRDAGSRLGTTGTARPNTVDALIVATAVAERAEHILTCDRKDIGPLAGSDLKVVPV